MHVRFLRSPKFEQGFSGTTNYANLIRFLHQMDRRYQRYQKRFSRFGKRPTAARSIPCMIVSIAIQWAFLSLLTPYSLGSFSDYNSSSFVRTIVRILRHDEVKRSQTSDR